MTELIAPETSGDPMETVLRFSQCCFGTQSGAWRPASAVRSFDWNKVVIQWRPGLLVAANMLEAMQTGRMDAGLGQHLLTLLTRELCPFISEFLLHQLVLEREKPSTDSRWRWIMMAFGQHALAGNRLRCEVDVKHCGPAVMLLRQWAAIAYYEIPYEEIERPMYRCPLGIESLNSSDQTAQIGVLTVARFCNTVSLEDAEAFDDRFDTEMPLFFAMCVLLVCA